MEKYLNKFYDFIDKVGKHNFILITFIIIVLIVTGLYQTFSLYTESEEMVIIDGVETYSFILNPDNNTNTVTIVAGNSKNIAITITNNSDVTLKYGAYYAASDLTNINIGYLTTTKDLPNGVIPGKSDYLLTVKINNNSASDITINFGIKYGFENGGDLPLETNEYWFEKYKQEPNKPNLDNGNLIPVYYDDTAEVWRKADENNLNNSWYDYDNKRWANAVMIDPNTVFDLSSNLNNGVIVGGTWDKTSGTVTTDGVDDYLDVGLSNYNFGTNLSLVIRVKFNALNSSDSSTADFFGNWQAGGLGLSLDTNDKIVFQIYNSSSSSYTNVTSSVVPTIGEWYTIVGTYNGTTMNLYINGQSAGSTSLTKTIAPIAEPFLIGANPEVDSGSITLFNPLSVTVSDTLVFGRALSSTEVSSGYVGVPVAEDKTSLLLQYDFTTDYNDLSVGSIIGDTNQSRTLGFYVWIPRYKYRVWNITRKGGDESTYAYSAFSNGIDIEFEEGKATTGNVKCKYNITAGDDELSDKCYYNGSSSDITRNDSNSDYVDAWYTHPSFTFGNDEKTGFWIGKFETTTDVAQEDVTVDVEPTILPNLESLAGLKISSLFTVSRKFQKYLSSDVVATMARNYEWGAVAYLSHSQFGICDDEGCKGVYNNNSSKGYTGRSCGNVSPNCNTLSNQYASALFDDGTLRYINSGYYDYKGYFIDYDGSVTATKDTTTIASTTGNITGVYDMSGGSVEFVLANMVDSNCQISNGVVNGLWNGSALLGNKYYNSYSYSENNSIAYMRSRLGDATGEVYGTEEIVADGINYLRVWSDGIDVVGGTSYGIYFGSDNYVWQTRGGRARPGIGDYYSANIFAMGRSAGGASGIGEDANNYTFRSIIF